jgi:hypothetical protein
MEPALWSGLLLAALGGIAVNLLSSEIDGALPGLCRRYVRRQAQRTPIRWRERATEEWLRDLEEQTGPLGRVKHALGCRIAASKLRRGEHDSEIYADDYTLSWLGALCLASTSMTALALMFKVGLLELEIFAALSTLALAEAALFSILPVSCSVGVLLFEPIVIAWVFGGEAALVVPSRLFIVPTISRLILVRYVAATFSWTVIVTLLGESVKASFPAPELKLPRIGNLLFRTISPRRGNSDIDTL